MERGRGIFAVRANMRVLLIDVPDETPTPDQLGRRERKKAETRRALRDAALARALDLGLENLTVTAVTDAVDIAPRTFFNYFACKEDALVTDGAQTAAELREQILARPDDETPLAALRAALTRTDSMLTAEAGREQSLARQRLIQEHPSLLARQLAQFAVMERAFAEALSERLGVDPDGDLRPEMLAAVAIGAFRVAVRHWSADGSHPLVTEIERAFDALDAGVLTDPTR